LISEKNKINFEKKIRGIACAALTAAASAVDHRRLQTKNITVDRKKIVER